MAEDPRQDVVGDLLPAGAAGNRCGLPPNSTTSVIVFGDLQCAAVDHCTLGGKMLSSLPDTNTA
jgi:hypothetical protein